MHRQGARVPRATYRIQLHREFTFRDVEALVPYLHALGVSHFYASPYLRARAGSLHGYDIVDHNALNPQIGSEADFAALVQALAAHGMGQILDIVPNHMGVGGNDNGWWLDVLENGQASQYAAFFDIDWRPVKDALRGKVLLPVLGEPYGALLDSGQLKLVFDAERGAFRVEYYEHHFPVDPHSYPRVLRLRHEQLAERLGREHPRLLEFDSLVAAFEHLPERWRSDPSELEERRRDKEIHKRRLAALCETAPEIRAYVEEVTARFNGEVAESDDGAERYGLLHELLEAQAYRLAHWQVASDEINYRRFFDINDLAGLRMERREVFEATHRRILSMVREGMLHGLRIDHPDGLFDPARYYRDLQAAVGEHPLGLYVVAEKILAVYEHLPEDWPVHGTTGYDFTNLVNGLFVDSAAERPLTRFYERFTGERKRFDELLYERKKFIAQRVLSSELTVLTNRLDQISEADRYTRDFTQNGLREALSEVVACFPVYRTYVTGEHVAEEDRRYVDWAISQARKRANVDDQIFDFLRAVLLCEGLDGRTPEYRAAVVDFAMRFQQYSAPVMAKGLEDTSFYIYNRLLSLNEVGGDPRRFGVSPAAFHHANLERAKRWPSGMLSSSTHDTKRSEDVRARLNVLSELHEPWREHVVRWGKLNRRRRREVAGVMAPTRNDEYLLYQTLIGAWPLEGLALDGDLAPWDAAAWERFRERVEQYMIKALREAKVNTSWIRVNAAYEHAMLEFIRALFAHREQAPFFADFLPFARRVARLGMYNSLSQTLLKLTVPGVPDIYQGNEIWDFSLVDPDNRRPVDYERRRGLLERLQQGEAAGVDARALLDDMASGVPKLYVTWRALHARRAHPDLFQQGNYEALEVAGERAAHLCAFARALDEALLVVLVPRLYATLAPDETLPLGETAWGTTTVALPPGRYHDRLGGGSYVADGEPVAVAELLRAFPLGLLTREP
ncbi:malto-oligosyltrehalose synthase [Ectothiorhodospiraceae bacterium 2226]|nr:malto-oligosyltrehalose synthase [Ectothiorhodospiraceae bacterium 2226]